jgi:hypothetical protein
MSSKNGRFSLYVKQGKFKVGVVPTDGICRLLLKLFFIKWGSLDMSAGASPVNFRTDLIALHA